MATFRYRGRDEHGQPVSGKVQGASQAEAVDTLRQQGYVILDLKPAATLALPSLLPPRRVAARDLAVLCRQMHTMLEAGVTIMGSLRIVGRQSVKSSLVRIMDAVRADLESGSTLAEALEAHHGPIPSIMINTIRAGEVGGMLPEVFSRLADHFEREHQVLSKVKAATTYPKVITMVALLVIIFIVAVVVPSFAGLFSGLGGELPGPTVMVLTASHMITRYWPLGLLAVAAIVMLYLLVKANPGGRRLIDRVALRIPVTGTIGLYRLLGRFCRTLAALLKSGVPILNALLVSSQTLDNTILSDGIMRARSAVRDGHSMVEPLRTMREFSPMAIEMMAVGEETGTLEEMLIKIAEMYEGEMERRVDQMASLIEPILILGLGGVVGFIMIAVFLPMLDILQHIR